MSRLGTALVVLLALLAAPLVAHEVPDRVEIAVLLRPEHGRMQIVARVPANALIDFLLPTQEAGHWVDLTNADALAAQAASVWIGDRISVRENGVALPSPQLRKIRLSRVDDPAFTTFDRALARINGPPLSPDTLVLQEQVTVDALLELPITSPDASFTFLPQFGRLGVLVYTRLTYLVPDGRIQRFDYEGDPPEFALDPSLGDTLRRFVTAGASYFFTVPECLLFAVCIALVFRRSVAPLAAFSLTFAVTQVLALLLADAWLASSPWMSVLCDAFVAAAVVSAGIEAIVAAPGRGLGLAAGAGALFGVACWSAFEPTAQFGGAHSLAASLAFAAGVVLCDLAALITSAWATRLLRFFRAAQAVGIVIAAIAIHISCQRMLARVDALTLVGIPVAPRQLVMWAALAAIVIGLLAWLQRHAGAGLPQAALRAPAHPPE